MDLQFGNESNLEPLSHLFVNSSKAESMQKYCKPGNIHAQEIFSNFTNMIVYDLKFVGPIEFKFVAPIPKQIKTTTMHLYEASNSTSTEKLPLKIEGGRGSEVRFLVL